MSYRKTALWPNPADALLLQAALLQDDRALEAWRTWQQHLGQNPPDYTQLRLVPLLHHNLRGLGVDPRALRQYRNDTMVFWIRNQQLFRFASGAALELTASGIDTLVLKGVPLACRFYPAPGLRPMSDVDLLVRPEQAVEAIGLFTRHGWGCSNDAVIGLDNLEELVAVRNALNLRDPGSGLELDLHWSLVKNSLADVEPLWAQTEDLELHGQRLATLSASNHFLHACIQAADWNQVRPIRWIPDAAMILRNTVVDWDRIVSLAGRMDLTEVVHDAVGALQKLLGMEVPKDTLERLRAKRSSLLSRIDYHTSARAPATLIGQPITRIVRYLRIGRPQGLGFLQYLKYNWGAKSILNAFSYGARLLWGEAFRRKGR